jgi:hypothetical protein
LGNFVQLLLFKTASNLFDSLPEKLKELIVGSPTRSTASRGAAEHRDLKLPNGTIFVKGKQIQ